MISRFMKLFFGWVIGITAYEFFHSLWQDKAMNWEDIINTSMVVFIGIIIGLGLRKFFKKNKT